MVKHLENKRQTWILVLGISYRVIKDRCVNILGSAGIHYNKSIGLPILYDTIVDTQTKIPVFYSHSYAGSGYRFHLQLKINNFYTGNFCTSNENPPELENGLNLFSIEGFHVTSYQANFVSRHTHDCHVGFLSPQAGVEIYNKMSENFLFSSYHNTKLQPSEKILAHTLC